VFAIFSLLRFRTSSLPLKEMTYFFISISLGIINSISSNNLTFIELILINLTIILTTYFLEKIGLKNENSKLILYEKVELLKPQNHTELLNDLRERTGLDIHRFEIGNINFLRDTADIKVYFNHFTENNYETVDNDYN